MTTRTVADVDAELTLTVGQHHAATLAGDSRMCELLRQVEDVLLDVRLSLPEQR